MVFALELANEWSDLRIEVWPQHTMRWGGKGERHAAYDGTPTLLLIVARWRPKLLCGDTPVVAAEPRDPGASAAPGI